MTMRGWHTAAPVRAHVARLRVDGMDVHQIAAAAGLPYPTVRDLAHNPRPKYVHNYTAAAIFAVVAPAPTFDPTPRRLQALACLGWGLSDLRDATGVSRETLGKARRGLPVAESTRRAVAVAYARLQGTRCDGVAADQVAACARRMGWVPPLGWDDIANGDEHGLAVAS